MALYKIWSSRVNNAEANEFVGGITENGLIWYDEITGQLRLYTGEPGGRIINAGSGSGSEISNGSSNVRVFPNGPATVSVNGAANVVVFDNTESTFNNIAAAGNVTAGFFIGDGSQLTGVAAALPDQTGQQGKYLSTDGTNLSWKGITSGAIIIGTRDSGEVSIDTFNGFLSITGREDTILVPLN